MYTLGISCYYHDSAAALLKNGNVIAAVEEERFSRKKFDDGFPKLAIEWCLKETGVKTFIIHARKAMLGKFTPKQNLNIPPLKYEYVNKLKKDFQDLEIIINGGITSTDQIKEHLDNVDGVMIGRSIYHSPYMLADIENKIFNNSEVLTRQEVVEKLIEYVKEEIKKGTRLNQIMRHTLGLFHGQTGSSFWKRYLSENMCVRDADVKKIDHIMDKVKFNPQSISAGQIE